MHGGPRKAGDAQLGADHLAPQVVTAAEQTARFRLDLPPLEG
jgi:hypothetical protein